VISPIGVFNVEEPAVSSLVAKFCSFAR